MQRRHQQATETAIPAGLAARAQLLEKALQTTNRSPRKTLRTIAVLLDGSAPAEHALSYAIAIGRQSAYSQQQTGASLRLVRVYSHLDDIDPWAFSHAAAGIKPSKREKQRYLAQIARKINRTEGLNTDTVLIDSPNSVDALVSGAAGADLVVIGSRRRRWLSRLWWFNTVDQLRRRISAPMLLTTGHSSPLNLTANPLFKHIVVPLDGSVLAQRAIGPAAMLARLSGSSLTLLNVQDTHWSLGSFEHTDPSGYLLSMKQRQQQTGVQVEAQVLTTSSDPRQAIASYADSREASLIAIATRGDFGLSRLMRGSMADYLLRNTKLPILLQNVPEPEQRPAITTVS
jgi:nucleotide-binding universal stress UspA family protein